jgi:hypothetical protein
MGAFAHAHVCMGRGVLWGIDSAGKSLEITPGSSLRDQEEHAQSGILHRNEKDSGGCLWERFSTMRMNREIWTDCCMVLSLLLWQTTTPLEA